MRTLPLVALSLLAFSIAPAASADPDKGHGHGHGKGAEIALAPPGARVVVHERDRAAVYSYYRTEFVAGRCPPGLARKGNGCLPPGQAVRAWALGAPLPASVAFYPLPSALLAQLTPAPAGYQYVRIDNDVLLVSSGPRVVVQSIGSLANLQDSSLPLIAEPDRDAMATYYLSEYRAGICPDGLMRTDSGCAVKPLWALGAPLDQSAPLELLPDTLLAQLSPAPEGAQYIRLGDHILLMMTETRVIRADILDLSRIGVAGVATVVPRPAGAVVPQALVVPQQVEVVGGACSPGLAKKHNGCLPPGHQIGHAK